MPWPEGIPNWLKNQWGVISGGVGSRQTTAELIDSLRPYAAAAPGGWGPRGVIYVQQIRSLATSIRNAADAVSKSGLTGTISQEHISDAPWSRSPAQQALSERYMIRAHVSYTNPEFLAGVPGAAPELSDWISHFTNSLPSTLEQLAEQVIGEARAVGSPPTPVTGINRLEIIRE